MISFDSFFQDFHHHNQGNSVVHTRQSEKIQDVEFDESGFEVLILPLTPPTHTHTPPHQLIKLGEEIETKS